MSTRIVAGTKSGIRVLVNPSGDAVDSVDVTTLALDNGTLWALLDHRQVCRIRDGKVDHVAIVDGPIGWCLLVKDGVAWVGTANAGLFRLDGNRMVPVASFDSAPTRSEWHQPGGRSPSTWSMAADADRIFVNVHVGGILASDDNGRSWASTIDLHHDVHQVSVGSDGRLWAATGIKSLAESRDAGRTWTYHGKGLHARYLTCAVPTSDGVLVAASSGHRATDGAIYRFDGEGFELCANGLPERLGATLNARQLAARGETAAVAGFDRCLYASHDGGRSWKVIDDGLPEVRAIVIR